MYDEKEIKLFSELFKARTDIFAIRWKKDNKNGYSPSYQYDTYRYKLHRIKDENFQNYQDKLFPPTFPIDTFSSIKSHKIIKRLANPKRFVGPPGIEPGTLRL